MSSPSPTDEPIQPIAYAVRGSQVVDREHLKILAICHYIWGGLLFLFSCFGLIYVAMGVAMASGAFAAGRTPAVGPAQPVSDRMMGTIFIIMGCVILVGGGSLAICTILSGRSIARQRGRIFSIVVAGLNCILFPFGTTLGVFTLIVVLRESVRLLYEDERSAQPSNGSNVAT